MLCCFCQPIPWRWFGCPKINHSSTIPEIQTLAAKKAPTRTGTRRVGSSTQRFEHQKGPFDERFYLIHFRQKYLRGELNEPFLNRTGGNPEVCMSHQGKIPQSNRGTNPDRNLWKIEVRSLFLSPGG